MFQGSMHHSAGPASLQTHSAASNTVTRNLFCSVFSCRFWLDFSKVSIFTHVAEFINSLLFSFDLINLFSWF